MAKARFNWRSSKSGRWVTPSYGRKHKSTTEKERRRKGK
jgi:hypothetical protein